eukprot:scaffold3551_cov408-Prasinococcus_capsulatus_cf.AAC.13
MKTVGASSSVSRCAMTLGKCSRSKCSITSWSVRMPSMDVVQYPVAKSSATSQSSCWRRRKRSAPSAGSCDRLPGLRRYQTRVLAGGGRTAFAGCPCQSA